VKADVPIGSVVPTADLQPVWAIFLKLKKLPKILTLLL